MEKERTARRVRIESVELPLGYGEKDLISAACGKLAAGPDEILEVAVLRRSLDARGVRPPRYVVTLGAVVDGKPGGDLKPWIDEGADPVPAVLPFRPRPIVVGAGPAGLFAAMRLAALGVTPIVVERGKPVEERRRDIRSYLRTGNPDPDSNIQFGEGGAGAFSDGKLTSRSKDPRKHWVLKKLAEAGAPGDILFDNRPHLGTDRLGTIVANIRRKLLSLGVEYRFGLKATGLLSQGGRLAGVETTSGNLTGDAVFLAVGHSAPDVYSFLDRCGVSLSAKGFAVGLRIEADQEALDRDRFGRHAGMPGLGAAEFALARRAGDGRGVYSFCMCPGGVVIPSGTEPGGLVVNGMSGSKRSSPFANSAIVVEVKPSDFGEGAMMGLRFRRDIERAAFALAGPRAVPASTVRAFISGGVGVPGRSNCPWPLVPADLARALPGFVAEGLRQTLPGMAAEITPLGEGTLIGVETRTSSPVRIDRGLDMQSLSTPGLYPVGEGAGYAGGIMSSAIDGVRAADAYVETLKARAKC